MKQPAWSHSALKDFEGCQRRYQEVKVLKNYPFTETEATRYGNQVHKAIEDYIAEGTPIPAEYSQFQPVVDAMIKKNGRKLAEYEMALTVDLKPTGWKDKDVWVRGIADILVVDDDNSALLFIVKNDMVKMSMARDDADKHWWEYRERTARLEASFANDVWNPNQTPLCGWCPVKTCEFNKKH